MMLLSLIYWLEGDFSASGSNNISNLSVYIYLWRNIYNVTYMINGVDTFSGLTERV